MTRRLDGASRVGGERLQPRTTALDPLPGPQDSTLREVATERGEQLAGPDAYRLRRDLDPEAHPVLGLPEHLDPPQCRPDVLDCLAALARPGDAQGRFCHRGGHEARHGERLPAPSPSGAVTSISPLHRGHCLLQRRSPVRQRGRADDDDPLRQRRGEQRPDVVRSIGSTSSTSRYSASDS